MQNKSRTNPNGKLTREGDEVRQRIMEFLAKNEIVICPVSLDEISAGVGMSHTAVQHHLGILSRQGLIKRNSRKARHIQIVKNGKESKGS